MALLAASESKQLKPPAPARRRKKTGQEEETEEAGAVRPNRRSRVGSEEPVALAAPKSPVAVARKSRRSPLPPSPGPITSKADIASLIEQSSELEEQEARVELMMIIQAFILEKRGKL